MATPLGDHLSNRIEPEMLEVCHADHLERYRFATEHARGRHVLDVGCATGYGTAKMAEVAESVLGVDLFEVGIAYARQHFESDRCQFRCDDLAGVSEGGDRFDLVVSFEVIEHVYDPLRFVQQVASVLHDEGYAVLSTPNRWVSAPDGGVSDPTHIREYSPEEFVAVLEEGGLEVVTLYGLHLGPAIWRRHALRARLGRLDVLGLKRWVPSRLKARLIGILGQTFAPANNPTAGQDGPRVESLYDVWIDEALSGAYSQIALCRKHSAHSC